MKSAERSWHGKQATILSKFRSNWDTAARDLSIAWWEVGRHLNAVYGFTDGHGTGAGTIPIQDYLELEEIYKIGQGTLAMARRFHKQFQAIPERDAVLAENPLWRSALTGTGAVTGLPSFPKNVFDRVLEGLNDNAEAKDACRWYIQNKLNARTILTAWEKYKTSRGELLRRF